MAIGWLETTYGNILTKVQEHLELVPQIHGGRATDGWPLSNPNLKAEAKQILHTLVASKKEQPLMEPRAVGFITSFIAVFGLTEGQRCTVF